MVRLRSGRRAAAAWLVRFTVAAAGVTAGCGRSETAVVLSLVVAPDSPLPDHVLIRSFDAGGEAFPEGVFAPETVSATGGLGTVLVYPASSAHERLRLHARAVRGKATMAEGVVTIVFEPERRVERELRLGGEPLDDQDGDSVPDAIDNCPALTNHDQRDREGDGTGDACSGANRAGTSWTPDAGGAPAELPDADPWGAPSAAEDGPLAGDGPPAPADASSPRPEPPASPADAAAPEAPGADDCDLADPVRVDRQMASASGDLTFDPDGFLVLAVERNIARLSRGAEPITILENALDPGRVLFGLRVLPGGGVLFTDDVVDALLLEDGLGGRRTFTMNAPLQLVRAPSGHFFVSGAQGELFRLDLESGQTEVVARTGGRPRGLAFSPDQRTLYVSDRQRRLLLRYPVGQDGTLGAATMVGRGLGDSPDGLATDICGNVYVADRLGGPLLRVTPRGRLETVSNRTGGLSALAFGSGRQGWDDRTLYGVSEETGGLIEIALGVRGAPVP